MTSTAPLKASTLSLLVLGALALQGCAGKQVWSPELESATKVFEQIAQDPVVAALAGEELSIAKYQLHLAQTAKDQYKPAAMVNHEAKVATLKALTAQQRARALSANHKLQTAMGQQPLLSEATLMAAAPPPPLMQPVLSAATPFTESDDIASQLAALRQQLSALQNQLQVQKTGDQTLGYQPTALPVSPSPMLPNALRDEGTMQTPSPVGIVERPMVQRAPQVRSTEEPIFAAAIPAQEQQSLPSSRQLHRELLAMNARSSSRGMALTLGDRYFEGRSARLWTKRAERHLDNVAGFLERNPELSLEIEAHTDNEASSEENHDLSIDRATAIKSELVLRGVEDGRINTNGFGESRPIAGNDNPLGRLQNRRVELIFPNIPSAKI